MSRRTRIWLWLIVVAGALALVFVGAALATDRSAFCATCHEMRPYYDAWSNGQHAGHAECIQCHVDAGLAARFEHKFVALGEVYAHFTGDTSFPRAVPPVVPNRRCASCHPTVRANVDGFPHALHAEKGTCAQCHVDAGHDVTAAALTQAGVYDPNANPARLGGKLATVGAGSANLPGHVPVSCSRCHDMRKTPCSACHEPPHKRRGECSTCHATGKTFRFRHPTTGA
ncbi:MAG: hypothetical protein FDZ75_07400, partial [Actinobacteria bacterium]